MMDDDQRTALLAANIMRNIHRLAAADTSVVRAVLEEGTRAMVDLDQVLENVGDAVVRRLARTQLLALVESEMHQTATNLDEPTAGDFAEDIITRLTTAYDLGWTKTSTTVETRAGQ
jgi:hypothetical protein